jgi:hypothetical protein
MTQVALVALVSGPNAPSGLVASSSRSVVALLASYSAAKSAVASGSGQVSAAIARHPSSPVLLYGSSVGQRGISAQTIQLLVPVAPNCIGALQHISPLPPGRAT